MMFLLISKHDAGDTGEGFFSLMISPVVNSELRVRSRVAGERGSQRKEAGEKGV
jgi:hypothetical protein